MFTVVAGTAQTGRGLGLNLTESCSRVGRAIGFLADGHLALGLKELTFSLLDATVGSGLDAALFLGAKFVSAAQTMTYLEPLGRRLRNHELATLQRVYASSIDYNRIRIKEGFAGIASTNRRPFVLGDTIYLKDVYPALDLLVHEAAHVWQFQHGGTDYMREALVSQAWGLGYDWQSSVPTTSWEALEPEQQAQLLESAFQAGYFETGVFVASMDGRSVDLTNYMRATLSQLHSGRGAT